MGIEQQPSLMQVHRAFAETEFGQTLAGQVRYERYKPDEVSNERWIKLLGADVNNLTHLPLTLGLARSLVDQLRRTQPGYLTPDEENLLGAAAIIHDWAEAIVGDITYNDKTEAHVAEEKRQLTFILASFNGSSSETIRSLIGRAASEVVFGHDTKLGFIFNTLERVGYFRTALRAADRLINQDAPDCDSGLRWLVGDVLVNHTEVLLERSQYLQPVARYLGRKSLDIDGAFALITPDTFLQYDKGKRTAKIEQFLQADMAFRGWRRGGSVPNV